MLQPGGAGSAAFLQLSGLTPGRTYFDVFSADLCATPGSGQYLGLCAATLGPLVAQISLPLGTDPFHVTAAAPSVTLGPYAPIIGTTLDVVCLEHHGGLVGRHSPVIRFTMQ